jgi:CRP-like cAMP-binding protein
MDRLRTSPLFQGLNPDQVERVLALGKFAHFPAGDTLVKLDSTECDLGALLSGTATAVTWDSDQIMELQPGAIYGALSFVDGRPQPVHIVARTACDVALFPAKELRALMNSDRELGFPFLATLTRVISHRYRTAISQLDALMDEVGDVWEHAL